MRIFSKFVFICNICFIASVFLRLMEMRNKQAGPHSGNVIPLPMLENFLVILGYGAILVNLLFCILCIVRMVSKSTLFQPKWIAVFNMLMFPVQVWYFFFSKF